MRKSILSVFLASLLFAATIMPAYAKHSPDPAFKSMDGHSRKLSDLRGKVVVVNFWATWCGPCQEELPRLAQLSAEYSSQPVAFVLISVDQPADRPKIPGKLQKLHVSQESWVGGDTDIMDGFGLGDVVPGTAILDQEGNILARIMGEARESDIRAAVDWLLKGKAGAAPKRLIKRY